MYVNFGSDASFVCPFLGSKDEVIWRGPQRLSLYSTNAIVNQARSQFNRIRITGNHTAGEYIMIIENFSNDDEGLYACDTVEDGRGRQYFISAVVAEKPSVIGNQRNLVIKTSLMKRTRFSIFVKSYEKPEITWAAISGGGKRGYWEIHTMNETVFEASSVIILELHSHFGNYGLKVRNSAGSIDIHIKLITSILQISQTNVICNASDAVNLSCYLNSNPVNLTVSNVWIHTYHGIVLRTFRGNIQGNRSTLSINFCVYKDAGNYTCKWILDSQQYSTTASVTVNSYPLLVDKRITSLKGQLLLEVIFYSEPKANSITWYHDYNKVTRNEKYQSTLDEVSTEISVYGKTIKTSAYLAVLTIPKARQGLHELEHGVYSCHIKNLFGFIEEFFYEKDIANASNLQKQGDTKKFSDENGTLNEENNTPQDVTNPSQNHGTSSVVYLDVRINKYEEIDSIPTPAEEQESLHLSSESSDDSEVLPKIVCTATQPINVYEDLHPSAIEMHTYRKRDQIIEKT
ncbi:TTN [Mytilus coruscus]|uniref:TTN n=1 Tax=Mytilus coruscus TaxID=42192 RepID=A0A6J8BZ35_MYTCO|nr:TTN [Mytilus coruscus]